MKKHDKTTIALVAILLVGLALILYPSVSDYINSFTASTAVADYSATVADMSAEDRQALLDDAAEYNSELSAAEDQMTWSEKWHDRYKSLLSVDGSDVMGEVSIPKINVKLPIYHGSDPETLQMGVGHLDWSSLPVGGESTHAVLSAHRGLPSATLFTHLDQMAVGDYFIITVGDETLTYEVDQILTVDPTDTEALRIVPGEDLCTLVTCTPYGINTQRLLVRGQRVPNDIEASEVTADAVTIDPRLVALALAIVVLLILIAIVLVKTRRKRKKI